MTKFTKPTIEEITEYCLAKGSRVDPEAFWNFYESKGWVIGKSPMKNWHCAIATWEKRQPKKQSMMERFTSRDWAN